MTNPTSSRVNSSLKNPLELQPLSQSERTRLEVAREEFDAQVVYLNTATMGLPPRRSWEAMQNALVEWRCGRANPAEYDASLTAARAAYAKLVNVEPRFVAVGSQVSVFAGLIAAALAPGSEVLTASGDFTSILFPFYAQSVRGIEVREVPLERLADAVTSRTSLVSVSAVQSADGRLADLDALERACASTGTRILLDTTQAVGWLPIDASRFAYTTGGGYKWLLAPRGCAYMTVQPEFLDDLIPNNAGWYAGEDIWNSIYGAPLRLASDARRFDVSPAWHAWIGAAPSLELLAEVGSSVLHRHAVGVANEFRRLVDLPLGDSAIVSALADAAVPEVMAKAAISGSFRAGRLRLSFHVSTSSADALRAADVLSGLLHP